MKKEEIVKNAKTKIEQFYEKNSQGVVLIWGPTATGKSDLSLQLTDFFDSEIISSDSRQIFRNMDIGTDKVSVETRKKIPHHLIDIVNPDQHYTAGQRNSDAKKIISQIVDQKKIPIVVGGTGLYIDTLYKNFSMPEVSPDYELREKLYAEEEKNPGSLHEKLAKVDPTEAKNHHPNSIRFIVRALEIFYKTGKPKAESFFQQPVERPLLMIGLWREKEDANRRIDTRIDWMLSHGLIEEVQSLLASGYSPDLQSMQGIGYKETVAYLQNKISFEELSDQIKTNTHHFAKRQRTRFRRYLHDSISSPKKD
ncbi:MAG TPA: tRNA (adenosine(37)-N6)-dimethylallyltransferase MiaA, partial [Candidatus Absconditabacterales bacterium]|nr:tRNA (adenosine(37)-N6)-dimethylallyltransferase MiaA [Candidatus Absconditabacterales bacterium]